MNIITTRELKKKIERGDEFALIEVLPASAFEKFHLPGAISIPLAEDFEERVLRTIPNKDCVIVVYCEHANCGESPEAGWRLERLGYRWVYDYVAGKSEWREAGLGGGPSRRAACHDDGG